MQSNYDVGIGNIGCGKFGKIGGSAKLLPKTSGEVSIWGLENVENSGK
jgi:hypothetical protein